MAMPGAAGGLPSDGRGRCTTRCHSPRRQRLGTRLGVYCEEELGLRPPRTACTVTLPSCAVSYDLSWPGLSRQHRYAQSQRTSASLIGHSRSSAFRLSAAAVSMSLTGENEVEQSFPRPCRQTYGGFKRKCELTSSIVPRGTSFHRSVELEFPPIGCDPAQFSGCYGLFPSPPELGAVNPDAVHDHGQPTRQGHDRFLLPTAPGDLHRPGLEPRPFLRMQHALSCFVEHDPHHLISAA